jgi:hypothetical protein
MSHLVNAQVERPRDSYAMLRFLLAQGKAGQGNGEFEKQEGIERSPLGSSQGGGVLAFKVRASGAVCAGQVAARSAEMNWQSLCDPSQNGRRLD